MTDAQIFGKQTSQIAADVVFALEGRFGELPDVAERIIERVIDWMNEQSRYDMSYSSIERYAEDNMWDIITSSCEWDEAIEGNDRCATYIRTKLSSGDGDEVYTRIKNLADEYFSQ